MTTIVCGHAPESGCGDGGHRPFAAAPWTDEQIAYALFLKKTCARLEVIAAEIGIAPYLVDDFVRDALLTIHHARHTRARGQKVEAWTDAIARNLGRTRRYGVARGSPICTRFLPTPRLGSGTND